MSRPADGNPGVDGQIHIKAVLANVRVFSSHTGPGARSIISVLFDRGARTG